MTFFQCKYAFSYENMTFYINKRRRKTPYMAFSMQIRLFRCLSEGVGCRQYVLNFKHFGSQFFNNFWNSKSSELSERGGGSSLIGNFSQFFPFFLVTPPLIDNCLPNKSQHGRLMNGWQTSWWTKEQQNIKQELIWIESRTVTNIIIQMQTFILDTL